MNFCRFVQFFGLDRIFRRSLFLFFDELFNFYIFSSILTTTNLFLWCKERRKRRRACPVSQTTLFHISKQKDANIRKENWLWIRDLTSAKKMQENLMNVKVSLPFWWSNKHPSPFATNSCFGKCTSTERWKAYKRVP